MLSVDGTLTCVPNIHNVDRALSGGAIASFIGLNCHIKHPVAAAVYDSAGSPNAVLWCALAKAVEPIAVPCGKYFLHLDST